MRLFRHLARFDRSPLGNILIKHTKSPLFTNAPKALVGLLVLGGVAALAASPAQAAPAPNLTFNIEARVTATGGGSGLGAIAQTLQARVLLHGNRTRVESSYAGQKSVTLVAPPYIYRLLPKSKAGVRWKLNGSRAQSFNGLGLDPQELIRNPGKIRALLLQNGAKRAGSGVLNGNAVDIYTISKPGEQLSSARAYLRKSDALPLKLEAAGKGLKVVALWSNYARPKDLSVALFRAPKDYKIRDAKSAPPMMF